MSRPRHHVIVNLGGSWSVTADGSARAMRRFASREEAVRFARSVSEAQHGDMYVHAADGSVSEKLSF